MRQVRNVLGASFGICALAACSGGATGSSSPMPAAQAPAVRRAAAHSWMRPDARCIKKLLYVSDFDTARVYVYDYQTGAQEGQLSGVGYPSGQCVDGAGNVYVAFLYNKMIVEYPHGGADAIRTFDVASYPSGCSVDRRGDLAVTTQSSVEVWAVNSSRDPVLYESGDCKYFQPAGYDNEGNLVAAGVSTGYAVNVCELPAGGSAFVTLSFNHTIVDPGATMWDGRHIALVDQEGGNGDQTVIWPSKISGTKIAASAAVTLTDDCQYPNSRVAQPFIVGEKNTPLNDREGNAVVGSDLICLYTQGAGKVNYWHYPGGSAPYTYLDPSPEIPNGQSVSIAP